MLVTRVGGSGLECGQEGAGIHAEALDELAQGLGDKAGGLSQFRTRRIFAERGEQFHHGRSGTIVIDAHELSYLVDLLARVEVAAGFAGVLAAGFAVGFVERVTRLRTGFSLTSPC